MIPKKLSYSIKLETESFSFSVSEKFHPLVKNFTFNLDDKNYMVHIYPGDKIVVTVVGNGSTEILSNAKLTKVNESSVDVDI